MRWILAPSREREYWMHKSPISEYFLFSFVFKWFMRWILAPSRYWSEGANIECINRGYLRFLNIFCFLLFSRDLCVEYSRPRDTDQRARILNAISDFWIFYVSFCFQEICACCIAPSDQCGLLLYLLLDSCGYPSLECEHTYWCQAFTIFDFYLKISESQTHTLCAVPVLYLNCPEMFDCCAEWVCRGPSVLGHNYVVDRLYTIRHRNVTIYILQLNQH